MAVDGGAGVQGREFLDANAASDGFCGCSPEFRLTVSTSIFRRLEKLVHSCAAYLLRRAVFAVKSLAFSSALSVCSLTGFIRGLPGGGSSREFCALENSAAVT